jgi:hypothetical protein
MKIAGHRIFRFRQIHAGGASGGCLPDPFAAPGRHQLQGRLAGAPAERSARGSQDVHGPAELDHRRQLHVDGHAPAHAGGGHHPVLPVLTPALPAAGLPPLPASAAAACAPASPRAARKSSIPSSCAGSWWTAAGANTAAAIPTSSAATGKKPSSCAIPRMSSAALNRPCICRKHNACAAAGGHSIFKA